MTTVFNPDRKEDGRFVSEYLLFKAFVEKVVPRMAGEKKTFAFCHFQGLRDLVDVYGHDSAEAKLARVLYQSALARLSTGTTRTTLLLIPGTADHTTSFETTSHLRRRAEAPLATHAEPTASVKASSSATTSAPKRIEHFFNSKDLCNNATNSCSSHGSCEKSSKGHWACVCKPSVLKSPDGHKKTTHWGGYGCQKKDVSIPFNIFFLLTIAMVLAVGYAVSLLYSVGETELPSVLSAGVAPVKRT